MLDESSVRADQWLWAARFFKTRRLARQALVAGKITRQGDKLKPSKLLKLGDTLVINKGELRFVIEIAGLSSVRGPAKRAQSLYVETQASQQARLEKRQMAKLMRPVKPAKNPDKLARRQLRHIKQHGWDD